MPRRGLTPDQIFDKQLRNVQGARQDIIDGVGRVTESPTEKAAQNLDKAKMNYIEAIDSGRMANNLRSVSLQEWQGKTVAKVDNVATGLELARDKVIEFQTWLGKRQDQIDQKLSSMKTRTLAENIARATTQMTEMAKVKYSRGRA